ncbi:hypothetical protein HY357_00590, partial [Candidatus Roizmanbacteria bacterium]|nr:hypothetical protein [Candidatus Roizmanbacteria bacterium]
AKNIWKNIFSGKLSPFYLLDSWQERWADGFALSSYYAHLPQAIISLISLISQIGAFKIFIIVRTLMLIFLPLMFFWAGTILRLPTVFSLILAFLSQAIFTNGLYGIDLSSFLWRGWGLSAQLMALFFMPQAFAYAIDYLENKRNLGKAVFFNFLVAQNHFGMFSLMLLGYPLYLLTNLTNWSDLIDWKKFKEPALRLFIFIGLTLFFISYFIIPFFLQGQYRNFSVWDPIWKFDSWGAKQIIVWFLNGELFDFNRFPFITLAVVFGLFLGLGILGKKEKEDRLFSFLSLLFIFYTVLFFGRTTLGKAIDLIPGFSEYHLHRIIVMVQFTGLFLGAWFIYSLSIKLTKIFSRGQLTSRLKSGPVVPHSSSQSEGSLRHSFVQTTDSQKNFVTLLHFVFVIFGFIVIYNLEQPIVNYAKDNNIWIERSNGAYKSDLPAYEKIKTKLLGLPRARIYAGKPGNWGKQFYVGETPVYMTLSRDGFPVIGFLPESWSPNSDPEQFFDENNIDAYNLYNVGYSLLPDSVKAPDFAKLLVKEGKYSLYQIETSGWFNFGQSNIAVKTKKTSLLNITRLWFGSNAFKRNDYPTIDLNKDQPDGKKWYIQMTDFNHFINLNDGMRRSIWEANPFAENIAVSSRSAGKASVSIKSQEVLVDGYKANLETKEDCHNCIVVLKQSFHPNWQVKVNGEATSIFPVFPFYIGIPIEQKGNYTVEALYKPNNLKIFLVLLEIIAFGLMGFLSLKRASKLF